MRQQLVMTLLMPLSCRSNCRCHRVESRLVESLLSHHVGESNPRLAWDDRMEISNSTRVTPLLNFHLVVHIALFVSHVRGDHFDETTDSQLRGQILLGEECAQGLLQGNKIVKTIFTVPGQSHTAV